MAQLGLAWTYHPLDPLPLDPDANCAKGLNRDAKVKGSKANLGS